MDAVIWQGYTAFLHEFGHTVAQPSVAVPILAVSCHALALHASPRSSFPRFCVVSPMYGQLQAFTLMDW